MMRSLLSRSAGLGIFSTIAVMLCVASCGGTGPVGAGAGGDGGGAEDARADSRADGEAGNVPLADAPFGCGSLTCRVDQFCLQPCCGGAAPECRPASDAGTCEPGFHFVSACIGSGGPGCQADPCKPPPPSCIDDPSEGVSGSNSCTQSGSSRVLSCICA